MFEEYIAIAKYNAPYSSNRRFLPNSTLTKQLSITAAPSTILGLFIIAV